MNGDDPEAVRRRRAAGARVPPAVQARRGHRHGLLPPARPQRDRRAARHAAAHVHADRASTPVPASSTPTGSAKEGVIDAGDADELVTQRPGPKLDAGQAAPTRRSATACKPALGRCDWAPYIERRLAPRRPRPACPLRSCSSSPSGSPTCPRASRCHPTVERLLAGRREMGEGKAPLDWGMRRDPGLRLAGGRGPPGAPQRARTAAAAPSPTATPCCTTRTARSRIGHLPAAAAHPRRTGAASSSTTRCSRRRRCWASSTATPPTAPRAGDLGGPVRRLRQRRPGHHRPVHRQRRGQVAAHVRPRRCSCRTATRARAPSTRSARLERFLQLVRRGQHPGRATRRRRRSSSTCCAGR